MLIRLQQRRGTSDQWISANTVLAAGEMAISTDDQTFKVGDGSTAWQDLPSFINIDQISAAGLQILAQSTGYTNTAVEAATTALSSSINTSATAQAEYTDQKIADLIDSAPDTLNTLNEIATALQSNDGEIDAITATLATKADSSHTHALGNISDVDVSLVEANQVLYFDSADSIWKPKTIVGIDELSVTTAVPSDGGGLSYNSETGELEFVPAVTGVTAGSFASLKASGPFAASTGGFHNYNDGAQDLAVSITTTISYTNLVSLTADHLCVSYAAAKLVRVVDSVETDLFTWSIIAGKDFSWTFYDQHDLAPGTEIEYLLKGQGTSSTSYIGQNSEVQMWVQEVAGALGGQPTSPDISVEISGSGSSTGNLEYNEGVLTYTPVLPAAAALSELTDVDLTDLSDTDVLAYDAASGTWLPGSAASSVTQLSDVVLDAAIADGHVLAYNSVTQEWESKDISEIKDIAPSLIEYNLQTSNYTIQSSDKDKMIVANENTPITITIPEETVESLLMPLGASVSIFQLYGAQVDVAAASGNITIRSTPGNQLRTQYSSATLVHFSYNDWILMGDLV